MLRRLGLTSLSRLKQASQDSKKWENRSEKLSHDLDRARKEIGEWRGKAEEAAKKLKLSEREAEQFQKFRLDVENKGAKAQKKAAELEELKLRLGTAERELTVARENLMAVEVKLDILEGAANVLDARTREAMVRRAAETGAPV